MRGRGAGYRNDESEPTCKRVCHMALTLLMVASLLLCVGCSETANQQRGRIEGWYQVMLIEEVAFAGAVLIGLESTSGEQIYVLSADSGAEQSEPGDAGHKVLVGRKYKLVLDKLDSVPTVSMCNPRLAEFYIDDQLIWQDGKLLLRDLYSCDQIEGARLVRSVPQSL
jgi:hypothetical protein